MPARRKLVLCLGAAVIILLAACAAISPPPAGRLGLKLSPATLGETISVQQHLTVERAGKIDELDAALEVDDQHIELVGLAFGQRVLSLRYDGVNLTSWRHAMLPAKVQADDVLEDIQLALWPLEAIAAALPAGWEVRDDGLQRNLLQNGKPVATISYSALPRWSGTIVIDNFRYQYRLTIQSAS